MSFTSPQQLRNSPASLYSFVRQHRTHGSGVNLLRLLFDAPAQASGTEKGTLPNDEGKQSNQSTFIANAFGYESPDENLIKRDLDTSRESISNNVVRVLNKAFSSDLPGSDWCKLYYDLKKLLAEEFSRTAGDTRRPANEVTLWDQTVTAASFLKTGLVQNLLENSWRDPLVATSVDKYQWQLLRVYYDGLAFIANAHHPSDLIGRWKALQEAQEAVAQLLEVTYPLAAEAYSDEDNLVFVVPNVGDLLSAQFNDGTTDTLKRRIELVFAEKIENELEPQVWLSGPSRGAINLGQTIRQELPLPQPGLEPLQRWWKNSGHSADKTGEEQCTVCRVRPIPSKAEGKEDKQKEKAHNRNICVTCLERRDKRSEKWSKKENLSETTIWIDEAADNNGRVALIAGSFDLFGWLDSIYLDSIAGRRLPSDNPDFGIKNFDPLVRCLATAMGNHVLSNELNDCLEGTNLLVGLNQEFPGVISPLEPYRYLVSDRKTSTDVPTIPFVGTADHDRAACFLFQGFFAKTTSFARLRRIWETTGEFWECAKEALGDLAGKQKYRLILQGQPIPSVGPSHVYDVRLGKVETSFVWDGSRLISADNLRYLAKQLELELPDNPDEKAIAEAVKQRLEEQGKLELSERPSRQEGLVRKPKTIAEVSNFRVEIEEHNYAPVIPLLSESQIFIALVPADKAMKVMSHLRDEYERQMSKVRNRLPLHLNLLTFNRRIPLYVAMDAVRRMLDRKTSSDTQ
ncbi:MAG: CRISPR-associated protein Csx11, partial [Nitrososphaera sp.]|nr:CRISPR-associated protein Csx11 [Nitrososphaera sp.]